MGSHEVDSTTIVQMDQGFAIAVLTGTGSHCDGRVGELRDISPIFPPKHTLIPSLSKLTGLVIELELLAKSLVVVNFSVIRHPNVRFDWKVRGVKDQTN